MSKLPIAPKDLGKAGKVWWKSVHQAFVFDPTQFELVHRAARQLDVIEDAAAVLRREGLTSKNRYGCTVAHPAVSIESNATALFRHLCRQLGIKDEGSK